MLHGRDDDEVVEAGSVGDRGVGGGGVCADGAVEEVDEGRGMNWKKVLTEVGKTAANVATGGMSDRILAAVGEKMSEGGRKELEEVAAASETRLELRKIESSERVQVAQSAAEVIKAEAQSDNVLAKTARPGSIWIMTLLIAANYAIPLGVNSFIRLRAMWAVNWSTRVDFTSLPTMKPEEIPNALFVVWASSMGGYIWSRRLEKRDRVRAENGM